MKLLKMANEALRVLAVAYKDIERREESVNDLIFVGLIGMIDPPKKGVKEAVKTCKKAGIKTVMITGDHIATATAIAKEIGILNSEEEAITGKELDKISDVNLKRDIKKYSVFARVSPEHKVRIVKAWQRTGAVVAMTGDGVNDSPALKNADIGIAMGKSGTDVAKNAADMILVDDNFVTIVEAVKQGRNIFNNIKKAIHFLLATNIGEFDSPLLAIQLLWINLVTDSFPAIALGLEKEENGIMERKPRNSKKSIFSEGLWYRIVTEGIMIGSLTLFAFSLGNKYYGVEVGRTMAFVSLGMLELGKTIVFNKKVKTINYSKNRLYSYFFEYFINGSKLFENNNVEEINFYNNFIKDDVEDYLCDILNKFRNLKSINLSTNKLCSGISKFLSHLKLLYRQKRTKIEKLNLNNCSLDKSSIYELSELLKSKNCILKCLYLNLNNINNDHVEPLLKSIKKNKYLKELYLGRNYIGNNSTNNICKIISKPLNSLESLYIYLNEIKNQDNLLRIIARTKVVYAKEEDKQNIIIDYDENSILKNLDLSKNNIDMKNRKQIMLFKNLINDTYLSCLDYSLILDTPESHEKHKRNNSQMLKDEVQLLINDINEIKNQRNDLFNFIDEVNINKNRYNDMFEKFIENEEINDILVQTIGDKNLFTVCEEEVENLISYELLDILGSTEKDLNDDNNYNIITNIIKYNILYKVNGGLIHKWFKGINKCLVIV